MVYVCKKYLYNKKRSIARQDFQIGKKKKPSLPGHRSLITFFTFPCPLSLLTDHSITLLRSRSYLGQADDSFFPCHLLALNPTWFRATRLP
jgi:hypothetical protein